MPFIAIQLILSCLRTTQQPVCTGSNTFNFVIRIVQPNLHGIVIIRTASLSLFDVQPLRSDNQPASLKLVIPTFNRPRDTLSLP